MQRGDSFHGFQVEQAVDWRSPAWWEMSNMRSTTPQTSSSSPPSILSNSHSTPPWVDPQEFPLSWSQLLLGGVVEDDKCSFTSLIQSKMDNWEDLGNQRDIHEIKREREDTDGCDEIHVSRSPWNQVVPVSSPRSCVTTSFSSSMLDFSNGRAGAEHHQHQQQHLLSSECNSKERGPPLKKTRPQPFTALSSFKVRKEKLGDRITALHQLVSPFGKTDTASVLLEATGYIRFLQSQIQALSSPYLDCGSQTIMEPEENGEARDLRSRGLCLVPITCTYQVGHKDNGADYWAPGRGFP